MNGPDPFRSSTWDRLGNARTATRRAPAKLAPLAVDPLARPVPSPLGVAALGVAASVPVALLAAFLLPAAVPVVVTLIGTTLVALVGGLRASDREALRWSQAVTRVVGLYVAAVAARAAGAALVPGLAVIDGPATVLQGRILALWVVFGACFGIALGVGRRAVELMDAETLAQEGNATRAILGWLGGVVAGVLLVHALPVTAMPRWAEVALVAAVSLALLVLADLRARVRSPGGSTDAVIDRPVRTTMLAVGAAFGAAMLVAVTLVPVAAAARVPDLGPAFGWVAEAVGGLFGDGRTPSFDAGGRFDDVPPERRVVERPAVGERWAPNLQVPDWVGWALVAGVVLVLLRPDRLAAAWRALLRKLRLGAGPGGRDDIVDEAVGPSREPETGDGHGGGARGGRLAEALRRLRPRPREPRAAILHDYFRLTRMLERRGYGREAAETPLAHAARVGEDPRWREVASLVSHARWSAHRVDPADAERVHVLVTELVELLPEAVPSS